MTSIKFLHGAGNRLHAMAAWLAAAQQQHRSVIVYAPDSAQGQMLDALLWTQTATGFIPHCRADSPLAAETPIVIATNLAAPPHDQCLLNLSNEVPPNFSRFEQLVEIVSNDEDDKLPGRERFRFYRDRGYPLDSQDISRGP
jgi:DNA polymerase-3 subunit chi